MALVNGVYVLFTDSDSFETFDFHTIKNTNSKYYKRGDLCRVGIPLELYKDIFLDMLPCDMLGNHADLRNNFTKLETAQWVEHNDEMYIMFERTSPQDFGGETTCVK